MRKISLALGFVASILLAAPAQAANFSAKDATAATIIFTNPGNCTTGCTPIFAWSDSTGANLVGVITAGADAASNTANGGIVYNRNMVYNGTTWDRWQGAVTNAGTFAVQLTGATNNINNIAGTVSLPTGAATSANQTSQITQETTTATGIGAPADAAWVSGSGSTIAILKNIAGGVGAAIPPCSAAPCTTTIGNTGSDPSSGKGTPSSVAINVSTATTTQLVAISGSTSIYVTSFDVIAGGTGNITFEYGTGASCGTGTTALTGAYNLTAQAGIAKGNGQGTVLKVPSGNALCVLTSAAVQMSGSVSYQQF